MIGDGHAMGVANQIVKHVGGTPRRGVWRRPPNAPQKEILQRIGHTFSAASGGFVAGYVMCWSPTVSTMV
jgi:hypothetical protein